MSVMKEIELLLKIFLIYCALKHARGSSWFSLLGSQTLTYHSHRNVIFMRQGTLYIIPYLYKNQMLLMLVFILCRPIRKTIQSLVGWYVVFSTKHSIKDLLWLVTSHTSGTNRWWRLFSRIFKCRGINKRWRVWDITSLVQIFVFHIIYW